MSKSDESGLLKALHAGQNEGYIAERAEARKTSSAMAFVARNLILKETELNPGTIAYVGGEYTRSLGAQDPIDMSLFTSQYKSKGGMQV